VALGEGRPNLGVDTSCGALWSAESIGNTRPSWWTGTFCPGRSGLARIAVHRAQRASRSWSPVLLPADPLPL
jgi:hypothetical protein